MFRIGLVVPGSGRFAEAGTAAALGAELGASEATRLAELLDQDFELVTARATGADASRQEALRLIEEAGVFAIAGGLDDASCFALSELAERRGVIFFNIGCASDALRGERCRPTTFNVAASTGMYVDALAEWLIEEAGLFRWHFVTPASEAGTAVHQRARRALLERGGEELGIASVPPEARDHRPLLNELRGSRPDVVFLGLEGAERAVFLDQYNELSPPFEVAGPFAGSLQQWISSPQTLAGIWPTLWHHKLFKYGASQLSDRFQDRFERPLDERGWAGWVAVKILAETVLRARTSEASELIRFLESDTAQFDGHKGRRLTFRRWDHQLRQPLYLLRLRIAAEDRWDVFDSLAELPRGSPAPGQTSGDFLDQVGDQADESRCPSARAQSEGARLRGANDASANRDGE